MFGGCTGLTTAPELPATTLAISCYKYMFYGCTNLTSAPELPATTLAEYCYSDMFDGCTGLTSPPELPATTLADYCYWDMFYDCTGLTTAPELPATTLTDGCYEGMFYGCTGLTSASELPATTLADCCYYRMFYGCTGICISETRTDEYNNEYRVPSSGTGTTADYALEDMFSNTGGTFTGTPEINKTYYMKSPVQTTLNMYYDLDDEGNVVETYFISAGANATVCEIITPGDASSQPATWEDGITYLFGFDLNTGDETYTYNVDRVTVSGNVKLIVLGGCTLTFSGGISVPEGSSLTICGPGTLNCGDSVPDYCAAIGGSGSYDDNTGECVPGNAGAITIVGAEVTAIGGWDGAGIGGGSQGSGGVIKIFGGTVVAIAGEAGTGIGDGRNSTNSCTISIDFTDDSSVKASSYTGTVTLLSDAVIRETTAELPAGTVSDLDVIADKTLVKGPLCGIKLNSANIEFKGLIRMRMAFIIPEDMVTRSDIYVAYYSESEDGLKLTEKIALKDGTKITSSSGKVSYGYYCPMRTKYYADTMHIRILDANGEPMAYTAGSSWAGIDYTYSPKQYAETVLGPTSTSSQKMKDLAQAFMDYGIAAKIQFDYKAEGCVVSDRVTAVTADEMGESLSYDKDVMTAMGLSTSINLDFKEDNSLYVYFTLPNGKTVGDYTFTIKKGNTTQTVTATPAGGKKYQLVVGNIAAKNLGDFYEFTITEKATNKSLTVRASAIGYAKAIVERYAEETDQAKINMMNLAKALYLYNKAAIAYFSN